MLKNIPLSEGRLVISKGDCSYQEVIDGFADAGRISVVTFNISWWRDRVLGEMKKSHAHQRLITNIPKRKDDYSNGGAEAAEDTIRQYLKRLDPSHFKPLSRVYFSFDNRAKIIKTDKVAYVGSSNFSDESQDNWEAGVILRDPTVLAAIEEEIDVLEKQSVRYYGKAMEKTVPPILAARLQLIGLLEEFSNWPTKDNRNAFIGLLARINEKFAEIDITWPFAQVRTGPISTSVDREVLRSIGLKLHDFDHIDDMIRKAENGEIDASEVEVNNDGDIPDYGFEGVIDLMERQRDDVIGEIGGHVKQFISQIETACSQISNSVAEIDNTKPKEQPPS